MAIVDDTGSPVRADDRDPRGRRSSSASSAATARRAGGARGGIDSPHTVAQWTEGETTRLLSSAELPGLYLLRPRFLTKAESVVYLLLKAAFPRNEISRAYAWRTCCR